MQLLVSVLHLLEKCGMICVGMAVHIHRYDSLYLIIRYSTTNEVTLLQDHLSTETSCYKVCIAPSNVDLIVCSRRCQTYIHHTSVLLLVTSLQGRGAGYVALMVGQVANLG